MDLFVYDVLEHTEQALRRASCRRVRYRRASRLGRGCGKPGRARGEHRPLGESPPAVSSLFRLHHCVALNTVTLYVCHHEKEDGKTPQRERYLEVSCVVERAHTKAVQKAQPCAMKNRDTDGWIFSGHPSYLSVSLLVNYSPK